MNIQEIAQRLINELSADAVMQRAKAEGVALLYNRLVEASENEKKAESAEEKKV